MERAKLYFYQAKFLVLIVLFKFLSIFIKKSHWVILERGVDARDNGYFFYKYMKKKHPEQKVYYIIDKKSADFNKVSEDAVQYGSLKNYWLAATAEKIISSHYATVVPNITLTTYRVSKLYKKTFFLQHGVIKDKLPRLFGDCAPVRLFVCGAEPEYHYVKDVFRHPEGVVKYTGLARYDSLHRFKTKNQILVMPTWRMFLTDEKEVLDSLYFKCWKQLLEDARLNQYMEETKTELIFYPHFELQKYLRLFDIKSNNVKIADFEHYDVQTLLKESKLLITDYSSVFFDFAYMRKPVIYFQFDREEFFGKHYEKGYFDYDTMGFGDVCFDVESAVDSVLKSAKKSFMLEQKYKDITEEFFPLNDTNNCERIYERIINKYKR